MQRPVIFIFFFCLCYKTTDAHPGVGILMDNTDNVFYTDLAHVWKISPDGQRSIAVKDVHTHEHYLDADGNLYVALYGAKKVKKITTDGTMTTIFESDGRWSPCGGLIAADGAIWIMEFSNRNKTRVRRLAPDGNETLFED